MGVIQDFTDLLGTERSKYVYKRTLIRFFEFVEMKPEEYLQDKERDYFKDIEEYYKHLKRNGKAPKTISNELSPIWKFLDYNYVEFDRREKQRFKSFTSRAKALTLDGILTREQLKCIFSVAELHKKALISFLLSSGCRIGEALSILEEDVDFDYSPTKITIPAIETKTQRSRVVFISDEATDFLKQWLKMKDEWLLRASSKSKSIGKTKKERDKRLFPFSYNLVYRFWNSLLIKCNLDKQDRSTKRYIYHIHTIRKAFNTRMKKAMNESIVELLMGHESLLGQSYDRFSIEEIAKAYNEAQHQVTVFHSGYGEDTISQLKETIANMQMNLQEKDKELKILKRMEYLRIKLDCGCEDEEEVAKELDMLEKKLLDDM